MQNLRGTLRRTAEEQQQAGSPTKPVRGERGEGDPAPDPDIGTDTVRPADPARGEQAPAEAEALSSA